jgi:CheY-like chemotaxis protein
MLLELLGHEVCVAHDGEQAVRSAEEFQPDVILLDLGMPTLDGYEACRRIRAQTWATSVVIVAVTGWGQEDARKRTSEVGFNLHLVKPLEPAVIDRLLKELAHEKHA